MQKLSLLLVGFAFLGGCTHQQFISENLHYQYMDIWDPATAHRQSNPNVQDMLMIAVADDTDYQKYGHDNHRELWAKAYFCDHPERHVYGWEGPLLWNYDHRTTSREAPPYVYPIYIPIHIVNHRQDQDDADIKMLNMITNYDLRQNPQDVCIRILAVQTEEEAFGVAPEKLLISNIVRIPAQEFQKFFNGEP